MSNLRPTKNRAAGLRLDNTSHTVPLKVVVSPDVDVPTLPWGTEWDGATFDEAPALNAHGASLREEFGL